ncbi:hypothetical protein BV22DRAFT_1019666 [Leucogyrophana mollusca]|uniref:Uncharacterized protein n=1 Tax=Leucogyrophana mollusca TaxID=85980 RepID=A0ACB8B743_9AGAM|nr:hypothetical protein BV22DRAFT_1019666 [Leucogyrophana mollusca]
MATWTQTDSTPGRRVFCRPLDVTETGFYYDSLFNSTADSVMHIHLRAAQDADKNLYSPANVTRSWSSVKRRFPLLAAEVQEHDSTIQFVLREQSVGTLCANEITFTDVSSFQDADRFVLDIMEGSRPLSSQMLARLYILRRTDLRDHFHAIIIIAHCITDGSSTSTVIRTFFDTLSSRFNHPTQPLETRLPMYRSLESGISYNGQNVPRRRWRRALGFAIYTVWKAKFQGGHTLPGNFTTLTPYTPAQSLLLVTNFSPETSSLILKNCRRHNITLNNAYYAISQVAMTRVLCRRYIRGEIGEDEWEYRKCQPMHFHGPLNLRPYLDSDWFKEGGSGDVGLNISFFQYTLPFMPLGKMSRPGTNNLELVNGAPSFSDLMSFGRFLLRCSMVKSQAEQIFNHPRFVDISVAAHVDRVPPSKEAALKWMQNGERLCSHEVPVAIPADKLGPVLSQGGSSLGNMDALVPLDYPLPSSHPLSPLSKKSHPHRAGYALFDGDHEASEPLRLHIEYWRTHLHARFGELYLGASTSQKRLQYNIFYDGNVFREEVVQEWLDEIRDATLWYLGQPVVDAGQLQSKL